MITLSVTAEIPEGTDLLGKSASDLQSNVTVGTSAIRGTLKNVDDYTGFSGLEAEQSGHYLVLKCECEDADSITVQLIGGVHGPVTLDPDGLIILRVTSNTQSVRVTAIKDGYDSVVKNYSLTGVTLAE